MRLKLSVAQNLVVAWGPSSWTNWTAQGQRAPFCYVVSLPNWVSIHVTTPKMLVLDVLVSKTLVSTLAEDLTHAYCRPQVYSFSLHI